MLLSLAQAALACSCAPRPGTFELALPPESRGFPTDGAVIGLFHGSWKPEDRQEIAQGLRLYREGVEVPVRRRLVGYTVELVPLQPLRPGTPYEVHRPHGYQRGRLLSDLELAIGLSDTTLRYPSARFTTGQGPAQAPAGLPALVEARAEDVWTCGQGVDLSVVVGLPEEVALGSVVDLEVQGIGVVDSARPHGPRVELYAGDTSCASPSVALPWQGPLQVRAVLR